MKQDHEQAEASSTVVFRAPAALVSALDAEAAAEGLSRSAVARRALLQRRGSGFPTAQGRTQAYGIAGVSGQCFGHAAKRKQQDQQAGL
jgi:hypothetical protein